MNAFTFVFFVVTVTLCARLIRVYLEQRHRKSEPPDDVEETLARIDTLEERVQVLERIVTESRFDLKQKIDSL